MSRIDIHTKLLQFANDNGIKQVYFCPPDNAHIRYPCIVYNAKDNRLFPADNMAGYFNFVQYEATIITEDVDSDLHYKLADSFKYGSVRNTFIEDNVSHYVVSIYDTK